MENNKTKSSAIQKILKCGIISWVAIIALWGIGSLKYDEYFLPSPKETIDSMKELIKDGTLWSDIVASVGRVIKRLATFNNFCCSYGSYCRKFQTCTLAR